MSAGGAVNTLIWVLVIIVIIVLIIVLLKFVVGAFAVLGMNAVPVIEPIKNYFLAT